MRRGEILKQAKRPAFLAVVVTVLFLLIFNIVLPLLKKDSHAAASFQANYNSGSYDASFSLGSGTASTDTSLPSLNAAGYNSTNSLQYAYDGTSTLKYATASNLPADKGSVEMKFQKSAYGNGVDQDKGSMYAPYGITYDSASGYMYIVDASNNRIIKTKIDGTGWQTYGHYGTGGAGQFNFNVSCDGYGLGNPGIRYDSATGFLYISDIGNNRIVKTKIDGTGWQTLGTAGSGTGQFTCPKGLDYDVSTDYLYITDWNSARVIKTKIDGTGWAAVANLPATRFNGLKYDSVNNWIYLVGSWYAYAYRIHPDGTGGSATPSLGISHGFGIDVDPASGYIYASGGGTIIKELWDGSNQTTLPGLTSSTDLFYDAPTQYLYISSANNHRVIKSQMDASGWTAYGSYYNNLFKFSNPSGVYYDSITSYYYIADSSNNRIIKTKIDGTGWRTFGMTGSGTGQFSNPINLTYDSVNGYFFIVDYNNSRIVKTKLDGNWTGWSTFTTACCWSETKYIQFDSATNWLIYNVGGSLKKMRPDFTEQTAISNPGNYYRTFWYDSTNDWIYSIASYAGDNKIYRSRLDGSSQTSFGGSGSGACQFSSPFGMSGDSSGNIFVSDTGNNRIVKTTNDCGTWQTLGSTGTGQNQFRSPIQMQYDSSSQYAYVTDQTNGRVVRTKIDGTGWQTTNDFNSKEKVLYSAQSTDDSRLVYDVASRKLRFYLAYSNKAQFAETPTLSLTDGNWYTVKASFNKAAHTVSIDLDGVNQVTQTYDTDWGSLSYGTSFYIGARNGSTTDRWDGMIDDININIESVDAVVPTNPTAGNTHFYYDSSKAVSFTSGNWGNSATPYITWSGATDPDSGLKGYYAYFGTDPTAEPNSTSGVLTPNLGARYFKTHVGVDGAEQNITVPANTLTSGVTYYLILSTQDNDLNTATKTSLFTYKYDGGVPDPPEVVNVSPVGCSTSSTFTFTWDAITDPISGIAGYEYKNGSSGTIQNAGNTGTLEKAPYQEGDNIIYIRTRDNAGNTSNWQTAVYCSTGIAYIIDGPTVVAGPSSITVNWVSSKTTTSYVQVYEGNTYISEQGHTSYEITHNVKVVGLEPEKTYRYKLVWTDSSGNLGESTWYETTTKPAPSVKNFKIEVLSPNRALATWETSEDSTGQFTYGIGTPSSNLDVSGSGRTFALNVENLTGGNIYSARIKSVNTDGYAFSSDYYTFETPPTPIVSLLRFEPVPDSPQPAVNVSWITNVETTSTLYYGVTGATKQEVSKSDKTKEHTIKVENLSDNTTYEGYVGGIDNFGNVAKSDNVSFKTKDDTRAPKIDNIMVETSNIGSGRDDSAKATIAFSTDEVAKCFVEYGEGISSINYSQKTSSDDASAKNHLLTISNLKPQTPYHFKITCSDKAENKTESPDQTVISGEITQSVFNIIIKTLNNLFGWLGKVM